MIEALWCSQTYKKKGWIMTLGGVTINSLSSTRRQAGADYLLLDSGAHLHGCPIEYPGQRKPLPDPGIHTASGRRLQHDGGRLVRVKLSEIRTNQCFPCVRCSKTHSLSLVLAQQKYW